MRSRNYQKSNNSSVVGTTAPGNSKANVPSMLGSRPRLLFGLPLLSLMLCFMVGKGALADTFYMGPGEPYTNLRQAFMAMDQGDTLIIRDGVYTGDDNRIMDGQMPPSGDPSTETFTVVRAENNGGVTFDGDGERLMCHLASGDHAYIHFEGLKWMNPDRDYSGGSVGAVELSSSGNDHLKFIRCGAMASDFTTEKIGWSVRRGSYYLFEECYVWGAARYGFMVQDIRNGDGAKKVILRRCVVRMDDVDGMNDPTGGIFIYEATEVEVQNCIVLDIDTSTWRNWTYSTAAFGIRRKDHDGDHGYDNHFRGCVALNILGWQHGTSENAPYTAAFGAASEYNASRPNSFVHCIGWDVMWGSYISGDSVGTPSVSNCSIQTVDDPHGDGPSTGARGLRLDSAWTAKNNVVINHQNYAMGGDFLSDYNAVYTTGVDFLGDFSGTNDFCDDNSNEVDPMTGFTYLLYVDDGSVLDAAGEDGADIGATVMKRYGVPGTFWGDPGYNTLTDDDLWPFPYEDQIKDDMRQYDPAGGPSGTRGFCSTGQQLNGVDDITLTSYIWEYLGNAIPEEIYGSDDSDGLDNATDTITGSSSGGCFIDW